MLTTTTVTTLPDLNYPGLTATVGDTLYFTTVESRNSSTNVGHIWRSDGTAAGTFRIRDPQDSSKDLAYSGELMLAPLADRLLVYRTDGTYADDLVSRLWSIDNATGVSTLLLQFDPPWFGSSPLGVVSNGIFYFTVRTEAESQHDAAQEEDELWRSDGTAAGTYLVKDIQPTVTSRGFLTADITDLTAVGSRVFFSGSTQDNGAELFVSDGTPAGTRMVTDLRAGTNDAGLGLGSNPHNFVALGERMVFASFVGDTSAEGMRLYVTNGTASGTTLLAQGMNLGDITRSGDGKLVYFTINSGGGQGLWRTDGTKGGTIKIFDGTTGSGLNAWGRRLYFTHLPDGGGAQREMVTDGTPQGTQPGKPEFDLGFGVWNWPRQVGGTSVFMASALATPSLLALHKTDGTAAGTRKVTSDGALDGFTVAETRVFYYSGFSNVPGTPGDAPPVLSVYDPNAGTIQGTVFDDVNANGARDGGEGALRGYKVFIDRNNDGVCNKNEQWTRASSTGRYRFDLLPAGKYRVRIVGVEGRRGSTADSFVAKVAPDGTFTRYFGRTERVLVAGIVYMDANKNGTIDNGESGMAGWTAFVDSDRDGTLDGDELTAITDDLGRFVFSTLPAGTWQVRVVGQSKYQLTAPGSGYRSVALAAGQSSGKANFGESRIA